MTHECPAYGCTRRVPNTRLMCRDHWFMLPKPLRDGIYATYTPGQGPGGPRPSDAYMANLAAAKTYLAERLAADPVRPPGEALVEVQAITLWQPWASLVAAGAKRFEFRSWCAPETLWGRTIAIHAAARPTKRSEVQELLLRIEQGEGPALALDTKLAVPLLERALSLPGSLPLSAVLCTAVLGRPVRNEVLADQLGVDLVNDSDRDEHTNWGWPLASIAVIDPPIRAMGRQQFWPVQVPDRPALVKAA